MLTHMIVELPLLFAIGWQIVPNGGARRWLAKYNGSGLTGLTFAMLTSAFWMMPLALDVAVLNPLVGWLKVVSVVLAGLLAQASMAEAKMPVQAFFVLNWVWMTGAVGVIYQQVPERLCSTYLLGDQSNAGIGLVLLAVVVTVSWIITAFRERPAEAPELPTAVKCDA